MINGKKIHAVLGKRITPNVVLLSLLALVLIAAVSVGGKMFGLLEYPIKLDFYIGEGANVIAITSAFVFGLKGGNDKLARQLGRTTITVFIVGALFLLRLFG